MLKKIGTKQFKIPFAMDLKVRKCLIELQMIAHNKNQFKVPKGIE